MPPPMRGAGSRGRCGRRSSGETSRVARFFTAAARRGGGGAGSVWGGGRAKARAARREGSRSPPQGGRAYPLGVAPARAVVSAADQQQLIIFEGPQILV